MDPIDFKNAKTTVFWDVEDFPDPNNGRSIDERIKSGLKKEGYEGEVFIKAYGEKKPENLNVVDGGVIDFTTKSEKKERLVRMSIDIRIWLLDVPESLRVPANLLVIAKTVKLEEREICSVLNRLVFNRYVNVLVVVDTDGTAEETILVRRKHPNPCSYWDWQGLLAGQKALRGEKIDGLLDEWHKELSRLMSESLIVGEDPPLLSANDDTAACVYCEKISIADPLC